MRKAHAFILFGACLLLGIGIAGATENCIGVIPAGSGQDFWNSVGAGASKAGKELGYSIYFRGPTDESNVNAQKDMIDIILKLNCKGLVLAPNIAERAKDVALLKARGIPTVYIDRDTGGADVLSVIATDNFNAGKLAAREMAKALKGRGNVAILRLKKGVPSTDDRERGFLEEAKKGGLKITIDEYLGTSVGDVRANAERILRNATAHLDGIFTPNEATSLGTLITLKQLKMSGKLIHIGFDSGNYLIKALANEEIYGLVVQRPFEMGYQGVQTIHRNLRGEHIALHNIDTGVIFATKENMNQPDISKLLQMDYGPLSDTLPPS